MPLPELFSLTGGEWRHLPPERSYASAWAVVYYLMQRREGQQSLHRVLETIPSNPCQPIFPLDSINRRYPAGGNPLQLAVVKWLG